MITLEEIVEQKERLNKILSSEIIITPKYFGNSITAKFQGSSEKYYKKGNKGVITMIDILVSDLYSKPIDHISDIKKHFPDGTYYFTNDYKSGKIIIDNAPLINKSLIDDNIFIICESLHDGKIDDYFKNHVTNCNNNQIWDILKTDDNVSSLIFRDKNDDKNAFKISRNNIMMEEYTTPSEIYSLIQADLIRNIDISKLKETKFDIDNKDVTYLYIINKIFCNYINTCKKYDVKNIDFGYPESMKVKDPIDKIKYLGANVADIISNNPTLYDFYCMCILTFRQKSLTSNTLLSDKTVFKHKEIYQEIKSICDNPMSNIPTPVF